MKQFRKKRSTVSRYIDEVCDYESQYERDNTTDCQCPPIVPKLLLSIYIILKPIPMIFCFFCGLLLTRFLAGA